MDFRFETTNFKVEERTSTSWIVDSSRSSVWEEAVFAIFVSFNRPLWYHEEVREILFLKNELTDRKEQIRRHKRKRIKEALFPCLIRYSNESIYRFYRTHTQKVANDNKTPHRLVLIILDLSTDSPPQTDGFSITISLRRSFWNLGVYKDFVKMSATWSKVLIGKIRMFFCVVCDCEQIFGLFRCVLCKRGTPDCWLIQCQICCRNRCRSE